MPKKFDLEIADDDHAPRMKMWLKRSKGCVTLCSKQGDDCAYELIRFYDDGVVVARYSCACSGWKTKVGGHLDIIPEG